MKVGIFDPYLDDVGGGEKYMMTLASCLAKHHEVSVFWDNKEDVDRLKERFSLDFRNITIAKNIFHPAVPLLEKLKASKDYDALIVLSDGSIPITLSKKLYLHIQQPLNPSAFKHWKTRLKLSRVNAIFYNSEFTAGFNRKIFKNVKNLVIYPPVDVQAKETKKENIIFHVGRFRVINVKNADYKKQQIMVDTFKTMIDKGLKDWKFVIATSTQDTDDPMFQRMLNSAKKYPIEFVINQPNRVLWATYNKAKIYWHASGYGEDLEKHPDYAEHFGISTVEGMGAGAVPVVINAGGQSEIITEGTHGLLWTTLEELQEKTLKVIKDETLRKKLSQNAIERAKDFSLQNFCKKVNALINDEQIR